MGTEAIRLTASKRAALSAFLDPPTPSVFSILSFFGRYMFGILPLNELLSFSYIDASSKVIITEASKVIRDAAKKMNLMSSLNQRIASSRPPSKKWKVALDF